MGWVADLSIPVASGQRVVREHFLWQFSGGRVNDTNYAPGEITAATESAPPNSTGSLTLKSVFDDGTEESVTKEFSIGDAPSEPPPPGEKVASQLGDFNIVWRQE